MRRIAAVTVTAALLAGAGAFAPAASAAPAERKVTKKWVTFHGKKGSVWRTIKANGTYTRTGDTVTVRGWLHDTKNNGWSPSVMFRAWVGDHWEYSKYYYAKTASGPADFKFSFNYGHFWTKSGVKHFQVREIAVSERTGKAGKSAKWKKLF